MIRRPPRSTQSRSSAASDVYKRQPLLCYKIFRFKSDNIKDELTWNRSEMKFAVENASVKKARYVLKSKAEDLELDPRKTKPKFPETDLCKLNDFSPSHSITFLPIFSDSNH